MKKTEEELEKLVELIREHVTPLCSCKCGRPRGEGLRMLSNFCFKHKGDSGADSKYNKPTTGNKKGSKL